MILGLLGSNAISDHRSEGFVCPYADWPETNLETLGFRTGNNLETLAISLETAFRTIRTGAALHSHEHLALGFSVL